MSMLGTKRKSEALDSNNSKQSKTCSETTTSTTTTTIASTKEKDTSTPIASISPSRIAFVHPLGGRYASPEMSRLWSPSQKFSNWRRLWVALAKAEHELELNITKEQIDAMEANIENIDFEYATRLERELRHDVMSHIKTFGKQVPLAAGIIHLGATSCFVTDNGELLSIKQSLSLVSTHMVRLISALGHMATTYRDLPTLGYTHYQPAQLTTVGKRTCLWLQDFVFDFQALTRFTKDLPFRGVKGTTGTQASFLHLFDGDHKKVGELDKRICRLMGFQRSIAVSGQTYTRKLDYQLLTLLSGIAQSAHKMCTDIRLLANLKQISEPFGKKQVGSSAMAYKQNPMRSERVCALARYVISLPANAANTHATQWFERTLDDSANRRMVLPEAFLAVDAILTILVNIVSGIRVWPEVIQKYVVGELPFMATENILMECVKKGGDRQELHEAIREHSVQAAANVREKGLGNDLLDRLRQDERFKVIHSNLDNLMDPKKFTGRAPEQVDMFIQELVTPILEEHKSQLEHGNTYALKC